ncbi:MAG: SRPBCC family protein [Propionibacteriales bacterium]|nr:SRPBCC family protein [Propionibacteriales bacterium]
MPEIRVETDIAASAEDIFDVIVDLRGYDRWLPASKAFPGTTEISAGPIGVGTTYVESSADGIRHGTVTAFDRPNGVVFEQPMTMKPRALGTVDIAVTYTLAPAGTSTHVVRVVDLTLPLALRPARPIVLRAFRREIERTVAALKAYVESSTPTD